MAFLCIIQPSNDLDANKDPTANKQNLIVSLEYEEQLEVLPDGVYYFGRPDCIECRVFQEPLEEYLAKYSLNIYYVNTQFFKNSFATFDDFLTEYNISSVPVLISFKNQKENLRCDNKEEIDLFIQEVLK